MIRRPDPRVRPSCRVVIVGAQKGGRSLVVSSLGFARLSAGVPAVFDPAERASAAFAPVAVAGDAGAAPAAAGPVFAVPVFAAPGRAAAAPSGAPNPAAGASFLFLFVASAPAQD